MTKRHPRRHFVRRGVALAIGAAAVQPLSAAWAAPARAPSHRVNEIARLAFVHTHTGETLDIVYREGAHYLGDALAEIDRVLRDHRSGDVHEIDRDLLDQLARVRRLLGMGKRPFHVISGYRSAKTNAMLAARSGGVATKSLHLQGRAIDVRMPGVELRTLHRAALSMQAGGVGFYGRSNFVHLDTGRVRRW